MTLPGCVLLADCEFCCLLYFDDVYVGTSSSCCSLHTKVVPVDPAAPSRLFYLPGGRLHTHFETKVCVSSCQNCTCTQGETTPKAFQPLFAHIKIWRNVTTRCNSQCKSSTLKSHSNRYF